ncbi:hypothetical protein CKA34_30635 (plasmid) [Rhizobium sp. 11515TR]|nr:hypothetical protein CKA34_30635 [Rhizobium sp. 11515TR]
MTLLNKWLHLLASGNLYVRSRELAPLSSQDASLRTTKAWVLPIDWEKEITTECVSTAFSIASACLTSEKAHPIA